MTTVYAFDRDGTCDTSLGPVPLDLIRMLAENHPTYAIGNQALCGEASIQGVEYLRQQVGNLDRDDSAHAADPARAARLRMVEAMHPDADRYVHVDDVDVGADRWDRWDYYTPDAFVTAVREGRMP